MPTFIPIEKTQLPDLIRQMRPGEEVILTENDRPVARLMVTADRSGRLPGSTH